MNMADYVTELKNILNKINRQSWTELKMLEDKVPVAQNAAGLEEINTLEKAKKALTLITEMLGEI
ncbi:MAG: hypothetical protein IKV89_02405 [Clostridia bacterium]|nr:hypothetical protein [Clostridia bacterium]